MSENVIAFNVNRPRRTRRTPKQSVITPDGTPLAGLIDSWQLALEASNKADTTIELYIRSARRFTAFLLDQGLPCDVEGVGAAHVRAFLVSEEKRTSVHTSSAHHAYLSVWFNWLISEEERTTFSPVLKGDKPHVPRKARKYLTQDELKALLAACKAPAPKDASPAAKAAHIFAAKRDEAMILVLIDNGARASGLAGIQLGGKESGVDLRGRRLRITLKGRDELWIPIGARTAAAIDRYLRVRARHNYSDSPSLWLAVRSKTPGSMTRWGVAHILAERGTQAGVENVHPHRFRGTAAARLLELGMDRDSVRRVLGWNSESMLVHYTEELADTRAREAHARLSPGDQI